MSEILEIQQRIEGLKNRDYYERRRHMAEMADIGSARADAERALIKAREREQQAQMVARRVVG